MRRAWAAVAAAVLLAGTACGDPSSGDGGGDLNAVQAAADAVDDAGSSRMRVTTGIDAVGGFEMTFEGVFDYEEKVGSATMTVDVPEGYPGMPTEPTKMIVDGTYFYVKGGFASTFGGTGAGWVRIDARDIPGGAAQMNQNPAQYVDFLRGATDDIEEVGEEDVRGVATTRYSAEITAQDILEYTDAESSKAFVERFEEMGGEIAPISTDVWVDADGLPRRMEMQVTVTGVPDLPGGEMTMDSRIELFDFGVEVDVEPPRKFEEGHPPPGI